MSSDVSETLHHLVIEVKDHLECLLGLIVTKLVSSGVTEEKTTRFVIFDTWASIFILTHVDPYPIALFHQQAESVRLVESGGKVHSHGVLTEISRLEI